MTFKQIRQSIQISVLLLTENVLCYCDDLTFYGESKESDRSDKRL